MTELNQGAAASVVQDEGATVHETLVLILRELRGQERRAAARLPQGLPLVASGEARVGAAEVKARWKLAKHEAWRRGVVGLTQRLSR